jgi:hypothetical protein
MRDFKTGTSPIHGDEIQSGVRTALTDKRLAYGKVPIAGKSGEWEAAYRSRGPLSSASDSASKTGLKIRRFFAP